MGVNTKYKDSVFSLLFSDPGVLRELYCALEGVALPAGVPVAVNTLQGVLFMGRVNDISFEIGGRLVVLLEHQSTINPSMALRRPGANCQRRVERHPFGTPKNESPRQTRRPPDSGPLGSIALPPGYSAYQSEHHSWTLPCRSYTAHLNGGQSFGDVVRLPNVGQMRRWRL